MMKKIINLLCCLGILVGTAQAQTFSQLYVFGDSLSDNGNMYALTNQYLPRAPYFNGRYTNGLVWSEFLINQLGLPSSALHNYAFGGARSDGDTPPGLLQQVESYLGLTPNADPDGVYFLWAGANNYLYNTGSSLGDTNQTVQDVKSTIESLANRGARYFVVINLPDIGTTPWAATEDHKNGSQDFSRHMSLLSSQHNTLLKAYLEKLPATLAQQGFLVTIVQVDMVAILYDAIVNPQRLGLTDTNEACYTGNLLGNYGETCANPENYLFWDTVHPTSTIHEELARKIKAALVENSLLPVNSFAQQFTAPSASKLLEMVEIDR